MDRNNKCDKIGMDENLHMEWYGPNKWLSKIILFFFILTNELFENNNC
jgi:hypothetical protein